VREPGRVLGNSERTHSVTAIVRGWTRWERAIAVQQKLIRHSDMRTTLNVYGDVVTDEMAQSHSKVVRMAIPRPS
jgi:hypothetical protein